MTFTTFYICVYHQHANNFFPILHKNIINFLNMTKPSRFVINTRWGHNNKKTSTIHLHLKQLNPAEISLLDLLTTDILIYIYIWVYGIEHRDRFKSVIKNMNTLSKPTIFAIPPELWVPYHNFSI